MNAIERPKILIIDDERAVLLSVSTLLERRGYAVQRAASGREGLDLAQQTKPDIVITDLAMPEMSGFGVIEALRKCDELKLVPVIVITAKVERDMMRRGMDLGADDFITKPFTEEELLHSIQARLEKKALLDELDAFAHTVAHDLRSPLGTLRGRVQLAQMMMARGDHEKVTHNLVSLDEATQRLTNIVDEMLLLAGLRRDQAAPLPVDSREVVNEALIRVEHVLRKHQAQVTLPEQWPDVVGFSPWLVHVWTNLLSNAAKYGGTPPRIRIKADLAADGIHARFAVCDQGPGLDEASQETVFTPFSDAAMRRARGHGIGLSIVRRIIAKHEGRIGIESAPGKGAEFWFELPLNAATPTGVTP